MSNNEKEAKKKYKARIRGICKSDRFCIICTKNDAREGRVNCQQCADYLRGFQKAQRAKLKSEGKCYRCKKIKEDKGKVCCIRCREEQTSEARARYARLKEEVFLAYGGFVCACCGETERLMLTIDHVNNDGASHRKCLSETSKDNSIVFRWMKKNNFPPGFQVLCFSCNLGKYHNGGVCPHKHRRTENFAMGLSAGLL